MVRRNQTLAQLDALILIPLILVGARVEISLVLQNESHNIPVVAMSSYAQTLLDQLLADVERADALGRGYERANELAKDHPEHAQDLFEFLEASLLAALSPSPDPVESEKMAAELARYLDNENDHALAAAVRESAGLVPNPSQIPELPVLVPKEVSQSSQNVTPISAIDRFSRRTQDPPTTLGCCYPEYAQARTGLTIKRLAESSGVPMRFLRGVDENPSATPEAARNEIARRGTRIGLDYNESKAVLGAEPAEQIGLAMAASGQDGLRSARVFSYRELVEACFRDDDEERALWLSFLDGTTPSD